MALPVEQIMSQLQRGDCEDIEEEDDIAEGPELEEELGNEELFKDTKLEIIEGERDGCNWLVIDDVHICFLRKDKGTKETTLWECSGRRRLGCQFKIRTTNPMRKKEWQASWWQKSLWQMSYWQMSYWQMSVWQM